MPDIKDITRQQQAPHSSQQQQRQAFEPQQPAAGAFDQKLGTNLGAPEAEEPYHPEEALPLENLLMASGEQLDMDKQGIGHTHLMSKEQNAGGNVKVVEPDAEEEVEETYPRQDSAPVVTEPDDEEEEIESPYRPEEALPLENLNVASGQQLDMDKQGIAHTHLMSKEQKKGAKAKIKGISARAAANIEHAAHATGDAIKSATGTLNAVDMLISQHREAESLIKKINAKTVDAHSRHHLLDALCDNLLAHMRVEEEIFYPAMEKAAVWSGHQFQHSEQEHIEAKKLITELLMLNPADVIFDQKMNELSSGLQIHIQQEEEVLFPIVKTKVDEKDLTHLGKQMHKRFKGLMGEHKNRFHAFEDVGKRPPTKKATRETANTV